MKWRVKWELKGRFWMARLVFLAVCAFIVASTINLWVGYKIENAFKTLGVAKPLPPAYSKPTLQRDFNVLNERNIFAARREQVNILEEASTPASGSWEEAVQSAIPATLIGTSVFPFPQYSLASIEVQGDIKIASINECQKPNENIDPLFSEILGPSANQSLAPCNRFLDYVVLKRIEENRIVFYNEHERRYEYLAMGEGYQPPLPKSRAVVTPQRGPSSGPAGLGETLRQTGTNSYEIEARDFDGLMANLSILASQARLVPAFENGKSIGFKIFNIIPDSIYAKVGLQNGDIITRVNGYELTSPDKALELYQMRSTAQQINLDYRRGGTSISSDVSIVGRPR